MSSLTEKRLRYDTARHKYFHRGKIAGLPKLPDTQRKAQAEQVAEGRTTASSKLDVKRVFYIMNKAWKGTDDSLSPDVFKQRLSAFWENKPQSIYRILQRTWKEIKLPVINNKDIKLPDLITFIEFMLERRIDNFVVLAQHPG